jgi:DNA-binding NtrC family response regulator
MSDRAQVMIVDDDADNRKVLTVVFEAAGFAVITAPDGAASLHRISAVPPDLVLLDVRMSGLSGLETLGKLRQLAPELPVIMLTSQTEIDDAVEATRLGANDFLIRPVPNEKLILAARLALERRQLEGEVRSLRRRVSAAGDLARLMGPSDQIRRTIRQVEDVAPSLLTVLILGETGTGKELVARAIHNQSARGKGPFMPLDCGAIPETLIESELFGHEKGAFSGADQKREGHVQAAQGGTLFLDEVGNLPFAMQSKFLRVIQEKRVQPLGGSRLIDIDVRFIAATNGGLEDRIDGGTFRQDLFYRLAEFTIHLVPLRERPEDVAPLAQRFLEEAGLELRRPVAAISPEASQLLGEHGWPGNVRELRNVIRQAVLQSQDVTIDVSDLHGLLRTRESRAPVRSPGGTLREIGSAAAAEAEKTAIEAALRTSHGNKSEAARLLQTDFKTLHLKMKRFGLQRGSGE